MKATLCFTLFASLAISAGCSHPSSVPVAPKPVESNATPVAATASAASAASPSLASAKVLTACKDLKKEQAALRDALAGAGVPTKALKRAFADLGVCAHQKTGAVAVALSKSTKASQACSDCVKGMRLVVYINAAGKRFDLATTTTAAVRQPEPQRFSLGSWKKSARPLYDYNKNGSFEALTCETVDVYPEMGRPVPQAVEYDQCIFTTLDIPGSQGLRVALEMLTHLTGVGTIPTSPLAGPKLVPGAKDVTGDGIPEIAYRLWDAENDNACGLTGGCTGEPGVLLYAPFQEREGGMPAGFDVWPTTKETRAAVAAFCAGAKPTMLSRLQREVCKIQKSNGKAKPSFSDARSERCKTPAMCPYFDVLTSHLNQMRNFFSAP